MQIIDFLQCQCQANFGKLCKNGCMCLTCCNFFISGNRKIKSIRKFMHIVSSFHFLPFEICGPHILPVQVRIQVNLYKKIPKNVFLGI